MPHMRGFTAPSVLQLRRARIVRHVRHRRGVQGLQGLRKRPLPVLLHRRPLGRRGDKSADRGAAQHQSARSRQESTEETLIASSSRTSHPARRGRVTHRTGVISCRHLRALLCAMLVRRMPSTRAIWGTAMGGGIHTKASSSSSRSCRVLPRNEEGRPHHCSHAAGEPPL